ncbi:hypothetical protein NDU88_003327 [Pleurodeles waltl]|uniref:Uncharacterized protein n=1 Tax=Pleurodeles waltl TaxID=8319 RepID=A0AAV7NKC3_PLEWA|nr:hypothetical protein NDU88_003327 [Pleurodeles waltl]
MIMGEDAVANIYFAVVAITIEAAINEATVDGGVEEKVNCEVKIANRDFVVHGNDFDMEQFTKMVALAAAWGARPSLANLQRASGETQRPAQRTPEESWCPDFITGQLHSCVDNTAVTAALSRQRGGIASVLRGTLGSEKSGVEKTEASMRNTHPLPRGR